MKAARFLTVTAQGFRTSVTTGIKAEVTKVATIDVSLQVGGAAEQVTVTAVGEAQLQTADQNTYTLDGIDVTNQVGFRGAFFTVEPTPTESVEEFRSTVANPNATFGRSAGAQTTLVIRRGLNCITLVS
jgi:hypothetical protein